jgi:hypothetical protein
MRKKRENDICVQVLPVVLPVVLWGILRHAIQLSSLTVPVRVPVWNIISFTPYKTFMGYLEYLLKKHGGRLLVN